MSLVPVKLAFIEFFRSFSRRGHGGRDFFWTTLLLLLIQLLGLVIVSSREGVLERSVDAFLGNRTGFGIPVLTTQNFLTETQPPMITESLRAELEAEGYQSAPFRELVNGQLIRLPDRETWAGNTNVDLLKFTGIATDFSGPLLPSVFLGGDVVPAPQLNDAWDIALNHGLFQKLFNLEKYRDSLKDRIPAHYFNQIPNSMDTLSSMSVIWLIVKTYGREDLMPFHIKWVNNLAIGARTNAFIIPLEMFNTFEAGRRNSNLCALVETQNPNSPRVHSIRFNRTFMLKADQRDALNARLEWMASHLDGKIQSGPGSIKLIFNSGARPGSGGEVDCGRGVPNLTFELVMGDAALPVEPDIVERIHPPAGFNATTTTISSSCETLSTTFLAISEQSKIDGSCIATYPTADQQSGYSKLMVYVRDRFEIKTLVEFINCRATAGHKNPVALKHLCVFADSENQILESRLMISGSYEDSLNRFGFLSELLGAISGPIGLGMLVMLVAILWVQLGTVLGHRRVRYAMLLSNGISWNQIRLMIVIQASLATAFGLALAVLLMWPIRLIVSTRMAPMTEKYDHITNGIPIDALPLQLGMVLIILAASALFTLILALVQVRLIGISAKKPLDILLV